MSSPSDFSITPFGKARGYGSGVRPLWKIQKYIEALFDNPNEICGISFSGGTFSSNRAYFLSAVGVDGSENQIMTPVNFEFYKDTPSGKC
nr:hypothetical protein [uncultured Celeribacter sp.]